MPYGPVVIGETSVRQQVALSFKCKPYRHTSTALVQVENGKHLHNVTPDINMHTTESMELKKIILQVKQWIEAAGQRRQRSSCGAVRRCKMHLLLSARIFSVDVFMMLQLT